MLRQNKILEYNKDREKPVSSTRDESITILEFFICYSYANLYDSFVMDMLKAFKHSVELREYWRLEKRKQRAQFPSFTILLLIVILSVIALVYKKKINCKIVE
jgi:hypothetical protein